MDEVFSFSMQERRVRKGDGGRIPVRLCVIWYSSFAFAQLLGVQEFRSYRSSDDSAEGSFCVSLQGLEVLSELL